MRLASIAFLLTSISWAQTITSIEPTSKEIVVRFTAPDTTTACTVDANYTSNFADTTNRLIDVDTSHFSNANSDISRNSKLTSGTRYRTVVIGQQVPYWKTLDVSAATGYRLTRGVPAFSPIYVKVTCNGVSDTKVAHTKSVPFGLTYAEATPADPSAAGFANWPSVIWNAKQDVPDPEYGTVIHRTDIGGVRGVVQTTAAPQEIVASAWTNPLFILSDDSNSASISGSSAVASITWPYDVVSVGTLLAGNLDSSGIDWFQTTVKGTSSAATAADGSIQVALSVDGGANNAYTAWHDLDIRTASAGVSYPASPTPGDFWQAAGGRPIPAQWLARRTGTFQYDQPTSTVTITHPADANGNPTGDSIGENWTTGTIFRTKRPTQFHIIAITAGTPVTVQFQETHGLSTGAKLAISGVDSWGTNAAPGGSCASYVNGPWTITVVNTTTVTLDSSSVTSCTFGRTYSVWTVGTAAGSPPTITVANTDFTLAAGFYAKFSGFTDGGWTSLNSGTYQIASPAFYTQFLPTGASSTGTYSGGASTTILAGLAQAFDDYAVNTIIDGNHLTLSSGPAASITTDTAWNVDPLHLLIRKKTTSADVVNVQYVSMKYQTSSGTAWTAAGGSICAPTEVADATSAMGSICNVGSGVQWVSRDGKKTVDFGVVPFPSSSMDGVAAVIPGKGTIGINPHDAKRIYFGWFQYGSTDGTVQGFDQQLIIAQYEGDFTPRDLNEGPLYSGDHVRPLLPNCYGNGKYNDGINPRVVLSGACVSYKLIAPSIVDMIVAYDNVEWRKFVTDRAYLPCNGGGAGRINFAYNSATDSVFGVMLCAQYDNQGGIIYVFDMGNEKPTSDPTSTVRMVSMKTSWAAETGMSKFHGGAGAHEGGYAQVAPHPVGIPSGVNDAITLNQSCHLCSPHIMNYTAVDGVAGAYLTRTLQTCAPYSASTLLKLPIPDGTGDRGCTVVDVSGEPGTDFPDTQLSGVRSANSAAHLAKTGVSGRAWIRDVQVGDTLLLYHDANLSEQNTEPGVVIQKTSLSGSQKRLVLYRGVDVKRWDLGSVSTSGSVDHTGDTKLLVTTFGYDSLGNGAYPAYFHFIPAVVPADLETLILKITLGHGDSGPKLVAGSLNNTYATIYGNPRLQVTKTAPDLLVASRGICFENKCPNSVSTIDSHLSYVYQASDLNKTDWVYDAGPWNGYGGIPPTLVPGTTHVYKWSAATLTLGGVSTPVYFKFLPMEMRVGTWVVRNVSSPTTGNVVTDSTPYTGCYVYAVDQCRTGSSVGDVYVTAPALDTVGGKAQCCGNDFSKTRDIAITAATSTMSRYLQALLRNNQTGGMTRALFSLWHNPRTEDSFKNWSGLNNGLLGVARERAVEFTKSELLTATMPPIIEDGIDRTHWWKQTVVVTPHTGADNFFIRFGYAHYGDVTNGQYRCTSNYADNCVMAAGTSSSNPYYFETSDTFSGISISSSPVTVNLPLVPNRVAYYEVVYRSGTTVLYTAPQQVLVTP